MATYKELLKREPKGGDLNGWKTRHRAAVVYPRRELEYPIVGLLDGWLAYADQHRERYESEIGEDYVLGKHWEEIGDALRGLLNGETGRLDCGTLDGIILDAMRQAKIDVNAK